MGGTQNDKSAANDARRAAASAKRSEKRRATGKVDVAALPWLALAAFVAEMAQTGGAVRIGLTRDGGAVALGLYHGDDYATEYVRPNEDFETALFGIAEIWLSDGVLGLERRMGQMGKTK